MTRVVKMLFALLAVLCSLVARADTIRQVIEAGARQTLLSIPAGDPAATPRIVATFDRVKSYLKEPLLMLKVAKEINTLAMTAGTTIVIASTAETLNDINLEFIIAHEAGHIVMNHTERRILTYQKYIPGEVTPEKATFANARIGREMMQVAHLGEYEADRFAVKVLSGLGRSKDQITEAFLGMGRTPDTATHPSTAKRVMNMRRTGEPNE
jgi:Zn-dependent protease with chaperone function